MELHRLDKSSRSTGPCCLYRDFGCPLTVPVPIPHPMPTQCPPNDVRQPVPNPLAWWLHFLPAPVLLGAVAINHFVELVAPLLLLMSRGPCAVGGIIQLLFQVGLLLSGNAFDADGASIPLIRQT